MNHLRAKVLGRIGGQAARGDKKRHGKLSWGEVNEIRADCRSSAEVAQDYGICRQHVDKNRRYDVWRSE